MREGGARLPVLVGAAAVSQREAPGGGLDAVGLMVAAARAALADSGAADVLVDRLAWVGVPDGTWPHPDPGRIVADALGAGAVHTVLADVGITQQELLTRACRAVVDGGAEVVLVVGGEARWREQQARRAGIELADPAPPPGAPDTHVRPRSLGIDDLEIERNIVNPVVAYALIDRALAAERGWPAAEHRDRLAGLWAAFAEVAAANPAAWERGAPSAAELHDPGPENRMLAFPYTRAMASQWNVDQAAALVLCSPEVADRAGIPAGHRIHPWASTVCDHAVPVVARPALHRSPGAAQAAARLLELAGVESVASIAHVDLYACFPAAVQVYAAELGLPLDPPFRPPPTVTGGMSFAGGPLNNYVLQAMVALVERLRADPGSLGLSSSVSGFLTKQGFSLWSSDPPPRGAFRHEDVTEEVAAAGPAAPVAADGASEVVVVSSTVDRTVFEPRVVVIAERPDGTRTIGATTDPDRVRAVEAGEPFAGPGTAVRVAPDGTLGE